jgi:hypothetical protein
LIKYREKKPKDAIISKILPGKNKSSNPENLNSREKKITQNNLQQPIN